MSLSFASASSQFLRNNTATPPITSFPFSMACWVYLNTTGATQWVVTTNDGSNHISLIARSSNLLRFQIRDPTSSIAETSTTVTGSTWEHYCAVAASGTDLRVFLNGGGKGTSTTPTVTVPSGMTQTEVANLSGSTFLNGRVALWAIWNVALSDAQVSQLSNGLHPLRMRPDALISLWPIWGISNPEPDLIGSVNLTLNNTPTVADNPYVGPMLLDNVHGQIAVAAGAPTGPPPLNTLLLMGLGR